MALPKTIQKSIPLYRLKKDSEDEVEISGWTITPGSQVLVGNPKTESFTFTYGHYKEAFFIPVRFVGKTILEGFVLLDEYHNDPVRKLIDFEPVTREELVEASKNDQDLAEALTCFETKEKPYNQRTRQIYDAFIMRFGIYQS